MDFKLTHYRIRRPIEGAEMAIVPLKKLLKFKAKIKGNIEKMDKIEPNYGLKSGNPAKDCRIDSELQQPERG